MNNGKRLIEVDFPLEQVSLDSVHEKNVRHGHISTLHIWPARRPLAASRAALIATLLPDPGNDEERKAIYRRLAGTVKEKIEQKKVGGRTVENRKRETEGGILHWGRESGPDLDWFREKIREAYGGRAPKVLDPFAGGGAIPLEAMRLGCDVTAIDINPVAWFILKCTLEYPQKLAGQTRPLPDFALNDREFMESFLKVKGFKGAALKRQLAKLGLDEDGNEPEPELIAHDPLLEADLAWQVRAWGRWVLTEARKKLAHRYPTYAEFQALKPGGKPFQPGALQLLEPDENGNVDVAPLNADHSKEYLDDPRNPRWVAKPTVAYLWARTVRCKGCRATIPLLKTKWLAKKDNKRVLLTVTPNADRTGVVFGVERNVPVVGGNAAQRREHDKRRGAGTMSRSGAQCPCCPTIMSMEDIRLEGRAGRLSAIMTAVVIDGPNGKQYRLPTDEEIRVTSVSQDEIEGLYAAVPFGLPTEPTPKAGSGASRAFSVDGYGLDQWAKLFTNRELLSIGTLIRIIRDQFSERVDVALKDSFSQGIFAMLVLALDRAINYMSTICIWEPKAQEIKQTFLRYALPITWDFAEGNPLAGVDRLFVGGVSNVSRCLSELENCANEQNMAIAVHQTSATSKMDTADVVVTDPPYYDAIPYSDLMDFFYIWIKRCTWGKLDSLGQAFSSELSPKWDHNKHDGELIDDASRFSGNRELSKKAYEDGMARALCRCAEALKDNGRLVVVFANKSPDAWETLASAVIRSGFVVDGSWPIATEMRGGVRNFGRASLASSIWLVCRKRPPARPGWDTAVLTEMRERIHTQLRAFWDAGIRGPDFVWAATGPALEAFSKYPIVKKADEPNAQMTVSEFLREVRRIVVDFVVGRVLTHNGDTEAASGLDDVTTYYLLHRNDFGLDDAPIGACILYALSCNLSDNDLADRFDILSRSGGTLLDDLVETEEGDDEDVEAEEVEGTAGGKGNKVKLKPWNQRKAKWLGYEGLGGRPVPLIDQAHRLMHLWRAGDEAKVDDYLDTRGLKRNALFAHLLQALIELAPAGSEERSILESLSNHIAARGGITAPRQTAMEI